VLHEKIQSFVLEEREELYALKKAGFSLGDIAKRLKRNKGSLSRELYRNAKYINVYSPIRAQKKAERRSYLQRRKAPLKTQPSTCLSVNTFGKDGRLSLLAEDFPVSILKNPSVLKQSIDMYIKKIGMYGGRNFGSIFPWHGKRG